MFLDKVYTTTPFSRDALTGDFGGFKTPSAAAAWIGYDHDDQTNGRLAMYMINYKNNKIGLQELEKVCQVTSVYGTHLVGSTITLNYNDGDIFEQKDGAGITSVGSPYTITVTNLPKGKGIVLYAKIDTDIVIKFANKPILDTSTGSDYTSGYYCFTFANIEGNKTDCISVWKTPGLSQ